MERIVEKRWVAVISEVNYRMSNSYLVDIGIYKICRLLGKIEA